MQQSGSTGEALKLRANISIAKKITPPRVKINSLEIPTVILKHNSRLPVETTYEFKNAQDPLSTIEIYLFFGNNKLDFDNISLGKFTLKDFPPALVSAQVKIKVSVTDKQLACISVLDPLTNEHLSLGYIDISKLEPPATVDKSQSYNFNINNLINDLFTMHKKGAPHTGKDISQDLELTFEEALLGVQKNIDVLRAEPCTACSGSGLKPGTVPTTCLNCKGTGFETIMVKGKPSHSYTCPKCNGRGELKELCSLCDGKTWVLNERPFALNLPPGIDSGAKICFPGGGEPGINGGRPGILYFDVFVCEHPFFARIGRHVSIRLPVRAEFAKRGGQLLVPSPEGKGYHFLNLPPKTKGGTVLKVYETDLYTLNVTLETYNPKNFFAVLPIKGRLDAIKTTLNNRDIEM